MVDAHALGACGLGRAGSNPASPTSFLCSTDASIRVRFPTGISVWSPGGRMEPLKRIKISILNVNR